MGGGVLQLVAAKGKEDDYIYIKPQMTYFKMVYRRYTNFSMENIREDFESPRVSDLQLDFTKKRRLRITVPRHGDMLNNIYLVLRLPDIYSYKVDGEDETKIYEFKWIKDLGFQIIDTVSLYIGKKLIDTHTGEWLQVWNELNKTTHQKNILNKMIGNEPELYDPSSITGTYPTFATSVNPPPSIENRLLYIPLHFWFCRKSSNSLPLIALQNNEVELEFTFRPIKELYTVAETDDIILLSLGSSVEITQKTQTAVINSFTNAESPDELGEQVFDTGKFFKKVVNNDKAFAAITWDDEVITWGDAAYGGTRFENGSSKEDFFNSESTKETIVDLVANSRSFLAVYKSEVYRSEYQDEKYSGKWVTDVNSYEGETWDRAYNLCNSNFKYQNSESKLEPEPEPELCSEDDVYVKGVSGNLSSSIGSVELIGHSNLKLYIYHKCNDSPDGNGFDISIGILNLTENAPPVLINSNNVSPPSAPSKNPQDYGNLNDINWFGFNSKDDSNNDIEFSETAKLRFYHRNDENLCFDILLNLDANTNKPPVTFQNELIYKYYCYNWGDPDYGKYGSGGTLKLTEYVKFPNSETDSGSEKWEIRIDEESDTQYIIIPGNPNIIQVVKPRHNLSLVDEDEFYIINNLTLETEPLVFRVFTHANVFIDYDNGPLLDINWCPNDSSIYKTDGAFMIQGFPDSNGIIEMFIYGNQLYGGNLGGYNNVLTDNYPEIQQLILNTNKLRVIETADAFTIIETREEEIEDGRFYGFSWGYHFLNPDLNLEIINPFIFRIGDISAPLPEESKLRIYKRNGDSYYENIYFDIFLNQDRNIENPSTTFQSTDESGIWKTNIGVYNGITWNRHFNLCNSNFQFNNGEYIRTDTGSTMGAIKLLGLSEITIFLYPNCVTSPEDSPSNDISMLKLSDNETKIINFQTVDSPSGGSNYGNLNDINWFAFYDDGNSDGISQINGYLLSDKNLFITRYDNGVNKGKIIYWGIKPNYINNINYDFLRLVDNFKNWRAANDDRDNDDNITEISKIVGLYVNDVSVLIQMESEPGQIQNSTEEYEGTYVFHQYGYGENIAKYNVSGGYWETGNLPIQVKGRYENKFRKFNVYKTKQAYLVQTGEKEIYLWGNPIYGGSYNGKGTTTAGIRDENKLEFDSDIIKIVNTEYSFAILFKKGAVEAWGHPEFGGGSSFATVKSLVSGSINIVENIISTDGSFAVVAKPNDNEGNTLIFVWGRENPVITNCREGTASIFSPFKNGWIDLFSSPDSFIFLHRGVQKIETLFFKPSLDNSVTLIENFMKGKDKEIIWNLKPHLEINYIFLDDMERNTLAKKQHNLLIDTLYHRRFHLKDVNATEFLFHLNLYHPTTVFVFVPKRSDTSETNNWSNYTNWLDVNQDPFFDASISSTVITRNNFELYRKNIISKIRILFNNMDRLTYEKDETYFTLLQKYQHNYSYDLSDIPIYSFQLDSKTIKPNGSVNMTQLKNVSMNIETLPIFSEDCYYILDLYAIQYNELVISNGIGGIKWGN